MDDSIDTFMAFTGQEREVATRYLQMTDSNAQAAIQLFFDSPDLASGPQQAPPVPSASRQQQRPSSDSRRSSDGEDDLDMDDEDESQDTAAARAAAHAADYEDDEAMARRMQEELYAGGDSSNGLDADGVRAPIARTTETLVGGPLDWAADTGGGVNPMVQQQMDQIRRRQQQRPGGASLWNQRPGSVWDENGQPSSSRQGLAQSTGGASNASAKATRLAELYRPPFDMMSRLSWEDARAGGKQDLKWILVNIQNNSIFDCQQLNRDVWSDPGVKEVIKENFIFVQYANDDPDGEEYMQYYFPLKDSDAAYPHIAIVDPRTGEQVKVWSGPPVPKAGDFLMQLMEFLDRYSLDTAKKNPVAKRKPEKSKSADIHTLTEEEQLNLALQNSLANDGGLALKDLDPDDLTKSTGDISKGKGKASEDVELTNGRSPPAPDSVFSLIPTDSPHIEPAADPAVTRIQFRHANGRVVRRFALSDRVSRIYEWLKSEPLEGKHGVEFELKASGKDLIDSLGETIADAGLKNSTVMVELIEG